MTQPDNPATCGDEERDLSWFLIAIIRNGAIVADYSPGWAEFDIEHHFEDTFSSAVMPPDLPIGMYRWSEFELGQWREGDAIEIKGGKWEPYPRRPEPAADAVEAAQVHTLAAMPCETVGEEDMENGCCRTCRARAAIAAMPGVGWVSSEVLAFLRGEGPLDGCYFGDKHPTERGAFWWRKHLPPAPAKE